MFYVSCNYINLFNLYLLLFSVDSVNPGFHNKVQKSVTFAAIPKMNVEENILPQEFLEKDSRYSDSPFNCSVEFSSSSVDSDDTKLMVHS